jgi:uncharacterized protein (TIGR01777 family)
MRVAITGASGLIGTALAESLRGDGHEVLRLVRGEPRNPEPDEVRWSPDAGYVDLEQLEGVDAVVHLAGAGVGDRPWTPSYRRTLRDSRVRGTHTIATALTQLDARPSVLVSASAIGYYGDAGDRVVDETASSGGGFLAGVVRAWESAADPARTAGIRVVHPRSGLVMTGRGGLLPRLLLPFKVGLGGRVGHGRQWWSGISLVDEVAALRFLISHEDLAGPVNLAAPEPARNTDWTSLIGELLHRPTRLAAPTLALRAVDGLLGNQASEMVLFSQRARPAVLEGAGFVFQHPDPESILRAALSEAA